VAAEEETIEAQADDLSRESILETSPKPETAEIAEPKVSIIKFEAAKLMGLAVKAMRGGRKISAAPFNLLENASRFAHMRVLSSLPSLERQEAEAPQAETTEEAGPESKAWYKKKKVIVGLGIVAVGTVVAYVAYKGIPSSGSPARS
jgi:hypothetical protein